MNKKRIILVWGIIIATILLVVSIFIFGGGDKKDDDEVIVKDNVKIITSETEIDYHPINVTEDTIAFNNDTKYQVGDVIVAGIIDSAPNGFIRRITSVTETNGIYEYKTEYAVLTDVFEEAHIIKTFAVTDNKVKDIDEIDNGVMTLNLSTDQEDATIKSLVYSENGDINIEETSAAKIKPSENGLGIVVELDDEIGESLQVNGQIEVTTYFELKIDIEDGEIDFGMAIHTDTSGELFVGYQEKLFDTDDKDKFNGEYEKEIINKALPNIQFLIGPVPVVITNDFELSAEVSAQLEGQIGTTVGVNAERISGFEYSSKSGDIVEINEKKYLSDGIEWKTEAKASGELEAGIYAHLITKLYGSTGTDLSVGIAGDVEGELVLGIDEQLTPTLYGNLALSIGPKASGKIVVTVPVVDYDLLEAEILKVPLPAFWEKEWEVPDPMFTAMQKGNFSCFAGTYVATPEDNDGYGGGKKLNPLELNKDGSLSGGGSHYSESFYPKTKPTSVVKQEDGSYLCKFYEYTDQAVDGYYESNYRASYYIIYPIGVIEQRDYVLENQSYLKDIVYIRCFVFDGGVLDVTYYSDSIANVVVDYDGEDWVSQDALTFEIGESFVSGTGKTYKVLSKLHNYNSGRDSLILETQDGKQWEIPRIPAFLYDKRTGIIYFNIYEYVSNPDYVEYNNM